MKEAVPMRLKCMRNRAARHYQHPNPCQTIVAAVVRASHGGQGGHCVELSLLHAREAAAASARARASWRCDCGSVQALPLIAAGAALTAPRGCQARTGWDRLAAAAQGLGQSSQLANVGPGEIVSWEGQADSYTRKMQTKNLLSNSALEWCLRTSQECPALWIPGLQVHGQAGQPMRNCSLGVSESAGSRM